MFISRAFIKQHPKTLFLLGDNDLRKGLGGMAKEFRGESNTLGIRTKKTPRRDVAAYYTDKEYTRNIINISADIEMAAELMTNKIFSFIWIPDSLGTGLANMQEKAPRTLGYLNKELRMLRLLFKHCVLSFE